MVAAGAVRLKATLVLAVLQCAHAQDHFRTSGEVERADVMMDSSRRSKGWGTVRFRTPVSNVKRRFTFCN